jgi:thiosulfate dehydrogenase
MRRRWNVAVIVLTIGVYIGAIVIGMHIKNFSLLGYAPRIRGKMIWEPPPRTSIPKGSLGDSIHQGALIFNATPLFASNYTSSRVSCTSCHAEGGIQPYASPMVDIAALFPMYNERAGHVISLRDRIQECFVRSENGKPLSYSGPEMQALVDYIDWLSVPLPNTKRFVGRGLIHLPNLKPDQKHGAEIYVAQCAGCHGKNGEGSAPMFPPLWGPQSYSDGAGMNNVQKMAAFVQHNMPQNRMGILSPQDAYDVSAFIHSQPRPAFNQAYKHF